MKTKLSLIAVTMIAATWLAVAGNDNQPRGVEQRLAALEQLVLAQQAQIEVLNVQVASQQWEIDRFAPLADVIYVYQSPAGLKVIETTVGLTVNGGLQSNNWLTVFDDLCLFGNFFNYGGQ